MKSLFTNEFYNKEVYINIENGNIISIFSNTVKIKTKLGLNSKLINYKNIFIFHIVFIGKHGSGKSQNCNRYLGTLTEIKLEN